MIDVSTNKPLQVSTVGMSDRVGPHIYLPLSQLKEVEKILDANGIRYWSAENALSMDGGPYRIYIHLRYDTDPAAVQAILDGVAE